MQPQPYAAELVAPSPDSSAATRQGHAAPLLCACRLQHVTCMLLAHEWSRFSCWQLRPTSNALPLLCPEASAVLTWPDEVGIIASTSASVLQFCMVNFAQLLPVCSVGSGAVILLAFHCINTAYLVCTHSQHFNAKVGSYCLKCVATPHDCMS